MGDLVTMANNGATLETGLLTPALRQSLATAEPDLTDEQFALVAQFAKSPPPPALPSSPAEINQIITALALVLKSPPGPMEHGRLKLAIYRKVLSKLTQPALQQAANRAIETLEWMPTPAEMLRLAQGHAGEAQRLHSLARLKLQAHTQREHDETIAKLRNKQLGHADLQNLTEFTARVADTQGLILTMMDGTRHYRTRETIQAREDEFKRALAADHERFSRARDDVVTEENRHG